MARQVIETETHASTGTRPRLIRRVTKAVEDAYRPGTVPLPGRSTFCKLFDTLSTRRHTFGWAVTRRQHQALRLEMMALFADLGMACG